MYMIHKKVDFIDVKILKLISINMNSSSSYFIAVFGAISIAICSRILIQYIWFGRKLGEDKIPGKLGFIPFLGETLSFLAATRSTKGSYEFVRQRRLRYGKWFKTRLFGEVNVFAPTVEGAKTVLSNEFGAYKKLFFRSMGDAVGRKNLGCVDREIHTRIRRILTDPFSMNSVSRFVPRFDRELCKRLAVLEREGRSFRVIEFTTKILFDGLCDMLISVTDPCTLQQLQKDVADVSHALLSFPLMIPGTRYYRGMKARGRLVETLKAMIKLRRDGEDEAADDFLQSLLRRDSEEKLDDEEIVDNLWPLIISGQSTSTAAIMWCVKFLDENPLVQDKLREEQLSILRNKPDGAPLNYDDLMKMTYASKVIKETLRMSNVVLWLPRVAQDDCKLDGHEIKKGWKVNIDIAHIHYDPAIYKDPTRFDPSRFDEMPKPYTYMPFGLGPRTCLGINMAKVIMLVFVHRLTSGYTWTIDDHDPSLERNALLPRLQNGCPITLKRLDK